MCSKQLAVDKVNEPLAAMQCQLIQLLPEFAAIAATQKW